MCAIRTVRVRVTGIHIIVFPLGLHSLCGMSAIVWLSSHSWLTHYWCSSAVYKAESPSCLGCTSDRLACTLATDTSSVDMWGKFLLAAAVGKWVDEALCGREFPLRVPFSS